MAQVPGEVDNMEGLPAPNNNNLSARWDSPDRGWEREQPDASTAAASLFECSRIKALAGTWKMAGVGVGREGREGTAGVVSVYLDDLEDGKRVTDTWNLSL